MSPQYVPLFWRVFFDLFFGYSSLFLEICLFSYEILHTSDGHQAKNNLCCALPCCGSLWAFWGPFWVCSSISNELLNTFSWNFENFKMFLLPLWYSDNQNTWKIMTCCFFVEVTLYRSGPILGVSLHVLKNWKYFHNILCITFWYYSDFLHLKKILC